MTTDLLRVAMTVVRSDFSAETIDSAIDKFRSHPLLEKDRKTEAWTFKQEQVEVLLLADQIVRWDEKMIIAFTSNNRMDGGRRQDIANTIVDLLVSRGPEGKTIEKLGNLCRTISQGSGESGKLAAALALNAVDRLLPQGSTHSNRANLLLSLAGISRISRLNFTGTIARYDFRGVTFDQCRLESVAWANCKFDEKTTFQSCQFTGGVVPAYCEGFGGITLTQCQLDPDASAIFTNAKIKEGKKRYSSEDLSSDVRSVINKFIIKGVAGLKTVTELNLAKGSISASRHREEVIRELLATVLEKHAISGGVVGYNVRPDAVEAVRFYAANNVFTGQLRTAFDSLIVGLGLNDSH